MLDKIISIIKRFFDHRKRPRSSLSFRACLALFNKLAKFQKRISYLFFIPAYPFTPRIKKEKGRKATPFSSIFFKINVSRGSVSNLLRTIKKSQEVSRFFEKSLFFYNLNSFLKYRKFIKIFEKEKPTKSRLSALGAILGFRIPDLYPKFYRIFHIPFVQLAESPIKSAISIAGRSLKTLEKTRFLDLLYFYKRISGVSVDELFYKKMSFSKLYSFMEKIRRSSWSFKTFRREIVIGREKPIIPGYIREYFPLIPISAIQIYKSLKGKISKFESVPQLKTYGKIVPFSQYKIVEKILPIKEITSILSKTNLIQASIGETLVKKIPYLETSRKPMYKMLLRETRIPSLPTKRLEYRISALKTSEQIIYNITNIREKTSRLTTEKVTPYTTYLTTGIREIYRKGGKPYVIYEYPKSPAMINISMPATATVGKPTKNVNYTFRNVINVTVNVASLESDRDIRELGRKIGKILAEEARRYGVEL